MGSVYEINLLRTIRIIIVEVVWKGIGHVPIIQQTFDRPLPRDRDRDELHLSWWIGSNLATMTLLSLEVLVKKLTI